MHYVGHKIQRHSGTWSTSYCGAPAVSCLKEGEISLGVWLLITPHGLC